VKPLVLRENHKTGTATKTFLGSQYFAKPTKEKERKTKTKTMEATSNNSEQAQYIPGSLRHSAKHPSGHMIMRDDSTSYEEDARQDVRGPRVASEEDCSDVVHRQHPASPLAQQRDYLRPGSIDSISLPGLDASENDESEKRAFVLQRCMAWSEDSHDWSEDSLDHLRAQRSSSLLKRYSHSDSLTIDAKYRNIDTIEDSPTSTCLYWEEQLDSFDIVQFPEH
jgi:hypothetical protein